MGARIFATKLIQYINVNNMQHTCCTYPAIYNALIYTYILYIYVIQFHVRFQ